MQISRADNLGAAGTGLQSIHAGHNNWRPTGKRLVLESHELFAERNDFNKHRLMVKDRQSGKATEIKLQEGEEVSLIARERGDPYVVTTACNTQGGDGLVTEYMRNLSIGLGETPAINHVRKVDGTKMPEGWIHPY